MKDKEKKKLFLEALGNVVENNKQQRGGLGNVVPDLASQNLAKGSLDKDIMRVKSSGLGSDLTEARTVIGGGSPPIVTKEASKISDIGDFRKRQSDLDMRQKLKSSFKAAAESGDKNMMSKLKKIALKMGKVGSTGLKALPLVGGALSLAMSPEDASAAIPGLDAADSIGMSAADENMMLAETQGRIDYENSQAKQDKLRALAQLAKLNK